MTKHFKNFIDRITGKTERELLARLKSREDRDKSAGEIVRALGLNGSMLEHVLSEIKRMKTLNDQEMHIRTLEEKVKKLQETREANISNIILKSEEISKLEGQLKSIGRALGWEKGDAFNN